MKKHFLILDSIGFENLPDFLSSIFGVKDRIISPILGMVFGGGIVALNTFVNDYIFTPAMGVYILGALTMFDIVMGVAWSIAQKDKEGNTKFDASKISRAAVRFVIQIFIVSSIFHLNKVYNEMIYDWLASSILLTFTVATLWSAIKNAAKIGWIQPDVYAALEAILSVDKLVKRITGRTNVEDAKRDND